MAVISCCMKAINILTQNFSKKLCFLIMVLLEPCTLTAQINTILCTFRNAFGPDSDFLRQFLYFFNAENIDDVLALVQICRLLQQFVQESGNC